MAFLQAACGGKPGTGATGSSWTMIQAWGEPEVEPLIRWRQGKHGTKTVDDGGCLFVGYWVVFYEIEIWKLKKKENKLRMQMFNKHITSTSIEGDGLNFELSSHQSNERYFKFLRWTQVWRHNMCLGGAACFDALCRYGTFSRIPIGTSLISINCLRGHGPDSCPVRLTFGTWNI